MLGTTVPRIHRAVDRLALSPQRTKGGHLRLSREDVERLRHLLGPDNQAADGLSHSDRQVVGALARRPLGIRSIRAVARASGVSPTTASRSLARLEQMGFVETITRTVVEGRIKQVQAWQVTTERIVEAVKLTVGLRFPVPKRVVRTGRLPSRVHHLFWSVPHPERLDLERDADYIAYRILVSEDVAALVWATLSLPRSAWAAASKIRGLDGPRRALAENLAR
jgi:DNA-binding transcriptional ArsR family regulator